LLFQVTDSTIFFFQLAKSHCILINEHNAPILISLALGVIINRIVWEKNKSIFPIASFFSEKACKKMQVVVIIDMYQEI
jgi:hypothetical protein